MLKLTATLQKTVKQFCFGFILFFNINFISAQNLSILSGISIPTGMYGSKDVTLNDAGFANIGISTMLLFEDNKKLKWLNYNICFLHNVNNLDGAAIEKFANGTNINKTNIQVQAIHPWQQFFLGAGPKLNLNNNGYQLHLGIMGGINILNSAAYNRYDSILFFKQKRLNANSFGIILHAGSDILLTSNIMLSFKSSYYYTSANYGEVILTDANGVVLQLQNPQKLQVPVNVFLVQTGLTFKLNSNSKNFLKKE